jgi:hypothetical protein
LVIHPRKNVRIGGKLEAFRMKMQPGCGKKWRNSLDLRVLGREKPDFLRHRRVSVVLVLAAGEGGWALFQALDLRGMRTEAPVAAADRQILLPEGRPICKMHLR